MKRQTGQCEACDRRRKLNRHGICRACAKAMDHTAGANDVTAVFTASHRLSDILPIADKDLDEPRRWYRRNK